MRMHWSPKSSRLNWKTSQGRVLGTIRVLTLLRTLFKLEFSSPRVLFRDLFKLMLELRNHSMIMQKMSSSMQWKRRQLRKSTMNLMLWLLTTLDPILELDRVWELKKRIYSRLFILSNGNRDWFTLATLRIRSLTPRTSTPPLTSPCTQDQSLSTMGTSSWLEVISNLRIST